jgi:NAD+ diphosphatase
MREIHSKKSDQSSSYSLFWKSTLPFPQSLMIAFTAEYLSGQITIDHREIEEANWFTIENLHRYRAK